MPSPEIRYGFVGIIIEDRDRFGARINQILSAHADCIVGRLGLPNLDDGSLSIVTLIVHASTDRIGSLTGKLGALPGVSIKSAMHRPIHPGATE
ncbi:MAG: CopG family transcriptional regulator [Spirochaeta sp.]|jgi:putative iron-only hydrogenase system regulator|nr:CopG family transcriptional regulator [Spirochaeta sp.]